MNAEPLFVRSEVAADLVVDHLDVVLALLDKPMAKTELLSRLGSESTLARMERHGLVVRDNEQYRAVSDVYQQLRQEGMMSFLTRCVLPAITASIERDGSTPTSLVSRHLRLGEATIRGLRQGAVAQLWSDLATISEVPAEGPVSQLKILVVGTSEVLRDELPEDEAVLTHLQRASRQRATDAERDLALLSQINFLADASRYASAQAAIERFIASFAAQTSTDITQADYFLTVASHWQIAHAHRSDDAVLRQSC